MRARDDVAAAGSALAFYAPEAAERDLRSAGRLEPSGSSASGRWAFLAWRQPIDRLVERDVDGIVVATFDPPEPHIAQLVRLGIPRDKLLLLRRAVAPAAEDSQPA